MFDEKKIISLITARGGSKGLPGKNIQEMLGKPLIAWTIEHAQKSKYIDRIIVSTDSQEIADVSIQFGAEVPFLRPAELARNTSTSMDAVFHAIRFLEDQSQFYDILVLLEPTSPLRDTEDVDAAIERLVATPGAESIVGVSNTEANHPDFLVRLENGFTVSYLKQKYKYKRRQDIDDVYFYEGSLYISFISALKERKNFFHERTLGYIFPIWKSYEVDEITDFILIEALLKAKLNGEID